MKSIFNDYIERYAVSKTLRFRMIPVYETSDNIENNRFLETDEMRKEAYKEVKVIFDKIHKAFIEERLAAYSLDWSNLYDAITKYNDDKNYAKKDLESIQSEYRKNIFEYLNAEKKKVVIKAADIIKDVKNGKETLIELTDEEKAKIESFDNFSVYFISYEQTRENVYAADIPASVAYRIVNDNFSKFVSNQRRFAKLPDEIKKRILATSPDYWTSVENFNSILSQKGIDAYNNALGGHTLEDGTKVQGVNEILNLAYQQKEFTKKVWFEPLYKQILSDRKSLSFLPDKFENEDELLAAVKDYGEELDVFVNTEFETQVNAMRDSVVDKDFVFVNKKQVSNLSLLAFENWSDITTRLKEAEVKESNNYSVSTIDSIGTDSINVVLSRFVEEVNNVESKYENIKNLNVVSYDTIKGYLDNVLLCENLLKILRLDDNLEGDVQFYSAYNNVYPTFRECIPLYNKVRSFATKKPFSTEKYKLNFNNPTLANGWDQNKEKANKCILLLKDGNYYVGIYKDSKHMVKEYDSPIEDCYKKMVYKLLPGANKMLPKVFFSAKGLKTYGENKYILDGYNAGKHKKGKDFDLKFCHDLIDYFKDCISKHPDWSKFGFDFSNTSSYEDMSGFYREVEEQGYKISYSYVTEENVKDLVKNGHMCLFQLYNKDFSAYSTGKKNLHTLYWNELFSEENEENCIFKLNGQAEMFYRPASYKNPFIHKKGSILIGKLDENGDTIPSEEYQQAMSDSNSMTVEELRTKYPNISFREAPHDIVKDKKYTESQYFFHTSLTINKNSKGNVKNTDVLATIRNNPDVNIIGIDRGERNLLYVSVIDQNRRILFQKSYNIIENSNGKVDYQNKLAEIEKSRNDARKNWKNIEQIKDVKTGYLSIVVHDVVELMIKYNAIVVLEDLNVGFKRGRFHIERQVYQNFEKMLIEKLNYYCSKDADKNQPGGIRHGYQLTSKFDSFSKLGKQSGFLFYVPASYTSKIDPLTGFVNLFTSEQLKYQSVEKARNFISSFDAIGYDKNKAGFYFEFSYSNFKLNKTDFNDHWTVYSCGNGRIVYTGKKGQEVRKKINVTDEMMQLFKDYGISITSTDLKDEILKINDKNFYSKLLWLFKVLVQLRYENEKEDFILSPVECDGRFFDSRVAANDEPLDGDANGAYHIALQGLRYLLTQINNGADKMSDEAGKQLYNYLKFVQEKA